MRRLVNNWLFGQVSQKMTGRLDTDVYANSCNELLNMHVFRQGGITRRPPMKKKLMADGYCRMIPFIIDKTNSYAVLLGASKIAVYDYSNNVIYDDLSLPTHSEAVHSWANITASQCHEVKFAQYYNDLYLVHPNFPLMRVRYSSGFIVSAPQVFVNQDVKPHNIVLTITMSGTSANETIGFTFDGVIHTFSITPTSTVSSIIDTLISYEYDGWTFHVSGNTITFTPDSVAGKYVMYAIDNKDYFKLEKASGGSAQSFTADFQFGDIDEEQDNGVVYGSDDFPDCYLNRKNDLNEYEFASDIAIVSERMFLVVRGNPSVVYASRPYGTSQITYPKRSNDTILDFVQFEMVINQETVMKESDDLPVQVAKLYGNNDEIQYEGTLYDQKLWLPPAENAISTKKDLKKWREGYYIDGTFVDYSKHDLAIEYDTSQTNIVNLIKRYTTDDSTPVNFIERAQVYYETYDEDVDTSKLSYSSSTHEYTNNAYYRLNQNNYVLATISNDGSGGLKYDYKLTEDKYINSRTDYFTKSGDTYTYVTDPVRSGLSSYYERTVVFTSETMYEYGYQYIYSGTTNQLRAKYAYNGMIESLSDNGAEVVKAVPLYIYNFSNEADIYEVDSTIDKVATASTGIEFQIASGKNDRITWIRLGDYIYVGTESSEWRMNQNINALESEIRMYSAYGSNNGLSVNISNDVVFLQKGNGLRLFYTNDYGLQTLELTSVNPEIMDGTIRELVDIASPEPMIFCLKSDGSIVNLCIDRTNGVQAFSKWTFGDDKPVSICVMEDNAKQILIALVSNGTDTFIAEFDTDENEHFIDCGMDYRLTADTTPVQDKDYYKLEDGEFVVVSDPTNPKQDGLYEYGLFDNVTEYVSRMKANPFDSVMEDGSVTIGEYKNVSKIIFRCLDTGRIRSYFNIKDSQITRTPVCCDREGVYVGGLADHAINVNGGSVKDLMITVESVSEEPLTLLAMAYELRLNKNGN